MPSKRMRISQIHLQNFKRFDDLTITGLTPDHRFVFLLGPNGSGKSSLLEAFNVCRSAANRRTGFDQWYHLKSTDDADEIDRELQQKQENDWGHALKKISVAFHDCEMPNWMKVDGWEASAFHLRGSNRATPDYFSNQVEDYRTLSGFRPDAQIILSNDHRLRQNYQRLVHHAQVVTLNPGQSADEAVFEESLRLIRQLQAATTRVFPGLTLEGLGNPTGDGTFVFRKDGSKKWRYKNLSAGEKSAFDLLLDLVLTANETDSTVYCIDEPELHMHSALQRRLMDEIDKIAPPHWQVWFATHSIGMVRWATDVLATDPGTVGFLDFQGRDFEKPVVISPEMPTRRFWKRQFGVALGELADLVMPDELFICEGDKGADGFDARVLETIFGDTHPTAAFQSAGGCSEVKGDGMALITHLAELAPGCTVRRLFDRDDRTEEEVAQLQQKGDRVLSRREIENYLFDRETLMRLVESMEKAGEWTAIESGINEEIASLTRPQRNKAPVDLKSAAPKMHQILRQKLQLPRAGSDYRAFALEYLVRLVERGSAVYQQLESDLWPNVRAK